MSAFGQPAPPSVPVAITLDVANLDVSWAFYQRAFGFQPARTSRAGMIFESRALTSPLHPGFELRLRAAFGRRPIGSGGGMLALSLRFADLPARVEHLSSFARWVGEAPPLPFTGDRVQLADPDGYVIELVR